MSVAIEKVDTAEAPTAPQPSLAAMFERVAANPDVPVEKLQALMDMQRTILQDRARVVFNAALSEAQAEMRPIAADATNPQTRSRYAKYDQLDRHLRPIYTAHGFGLSFDTEESHLPEHIRVVCLVSHRDGHERKYRVDMPADGKGAKGGDVMTKTHAAGAAMSYGMRYLLKMIFNVAVGEDDRDGNDLEDERVDRTPDGFTAWWTDIKATAANGIGELKRAWTDSPQVFRDHVFGVRALKQQWLDVKARAEKAGGK